jgi:hypothetical protein
MGAFDGELAALGITTRSGRPEKDEFAYKEVSPKVGKTYLVSFGFDLEEATVLSLHNELGVIRLKNRKKTYAGYRREQSVVLRNSTFYKPLYNPKPK